HMAEHAKRLAAWLELWQQALPKGMGRKPKPRDWEAAIECFIAALKADVEEKPLSWWMRIRLLHELQKALAAQGVPGEALRPLLLAIILRVYFA
ncbi:MAG: hypothetical protein N2441_05015, partial [Rhodocyclaceae bacterium]|nr:hypothetical protein [Rhodocyclaceae bacterium]